jgi:hypothetical protein
MIDDLADPTAKLYLEGKLSELVPATGTGAPISELKPEKQKKGRPKKLTKQYVLPEYDFHSQIPDCRRRQSGLSHHIEG